MTCNLSKQKSKWLMINRLQWFFDIQIVFLVWSSHSFLKWFWLHFLLLYVYYFLLYVFAIAHFYGCCIRLALFASSINAISCTPITFCIVGSTFPYAVNHGSNINIVRHSIVKVCQTCGLLRYGSTSAPFCFRLSILRLDKTYINI